MELYIILLVVIFIIFFNFLSIKKIPQKTVYIIERSGNYLTSAHTGFFILIPFIDTVRAKVSLANMSETSPTLLFPTKNKKTLYLKYMFTFHVVDPVKATYTLPNGLSNVIQNGLFDITSTMELQTALTSQNSIESEIIHFINQSENKYGCVLDSFEIISLDSKWNEIPSHGNKSEDFMVNNTSDFNAIEEFK